MDAGEAIVVGDLPYDAQAAGKIGLRAIGVLCGGFPEQDLRAAGFVEIYRDPADLLTQFDQTAIGADAPRRRIGIILPSALATVGLVMAVAAALMICRGPKHDIRNVSAEQQMPWCAGSCFLALGDLPALGAGGADDLIFLPGRSLVGPWSKRDKSAWGAAGGLGSRPGPLCRRACPERRKNYSAFSVQVRSP